MKFKLQKIVSIIVMLGMLFPTSVFAAEKAHVSDPSPSVFINEVHYDNDGTDTGEAIEIAGPAGTDLSGGAWFYIMAQTERNTIPTIYPGLSRIRKMGMGPLHLPTLKTESRMGHRMGLHWWMHLPMCYYSSVTKVPLKPLKDQLLD